MTPRRTLTRLAVAATAVLLTAGCVQTTGGEAGGDAPDTLTFATGFTIDDLDPLENAFWGPEFGYVELLMRPDRAGEPTPWVLTDLTSTGPTTWELTLPEGATFVNGTVLDADALADLITFQLAENASLAAALPGASAAATGPLQVTLTTAEPAPRVPALLADESILPVYDVAAYRAHRDSGAPASELVGAGIYTGPYVVDSLDGAVAQLSPRADHWKGAPALSAVTVRFVPEASARIQAVQSGEADIALYPSTSSAPTLQDRDDIFYVTGEPTGPTFQLVLNQQLAPFDDERVRRAVYSAVDYDSIANDVMNGFYLPATGLYTDSRPWAEKTQATDVAAAAALLDEAGWARDGEGPRTRDGQELRFSVLTYPQQPDSDTIALAFQAQLAQLGIGVDIRQVPDLDAEMKEATTWHSAIAGNGFMSYGGDYVYPLVRYVSTDGERNYGGIVDPELDAMIDRLAVELDTTARDDLLRQVQQRIADRGYLAYIGLRKPAVVTGPAWKGYEIEGSNLWVSHDTAPTG
ncbi:MULTISPECIES: ABC transporter substrate-binding protein [Pseudonocardia]|uniref:Nickel-binding periplasmic protein n=2 Tax=Pseudonocardia TaxID=1847 RepID=A0A1Y2N898_PSEAH|nr:MULTISPECIES: ABC transporter substrate-binding protein [Pseudonocardia]OSY43307.1 Nickel-binding periplasmic protein precursor [Pseudonocardia autotrophica]TDN71795.1 peptide/nickel transport system substrate-binding protein [Pseudonocardia autotrophica]BBG02482.1 peptide ABC transporter substrate-binding protein [Pseudonocardia autotrophica]GEC26937.1 peptide ABC transporter substrate-binding protein [Pseudonocardia saturnea]